MGMRQTGRNGKTTADADAPLRPDTRTQTDTVHPRTLVRFLGENDGSNRNARKSYREDSGTLPFSLGHLPSCTRVFGPPQLSSLWNATHAISRVALFSVSAARELSLRVASPEVLSQLPLSRGRFSGRRPFDKAHHCPVTGYQ